MSHSQRSLYDHLFCLYHSQEFFECKISLYSITPLLTFHESCDGPYIIYGLFTVGISETLQDVTYVEFRSRKVCIDRYFRRRKGGLSWDKDTTS